MTVQITDEEMGAVCDAIAEALGDAMDCTRNWGAWSYGTMTQDDFLLVAEDSDRTSEIATAAINAIPHQARTQAATDVLAERRRQIEQEGWTPEHDDQYAPIALALASASYAMGDLYQTAGKPPSIWPWNPLTWMPGTDRRNYVKAGALILAAIERIDRAEAKKGGAA